MKLYDELFFICMIWLNGVALPNWECFLWTCCLYNSWRWEGGRRKDCSFHRQTEGARSQRMGWI